MTAESAEAGRLDRAIGRVVAEQNCSGCGACCLLDPALTMQLDEQGYSRPTRTDRSPAPQARAAEVFATVCPGRRVSSVRPAGVSYHPTLGPVVSAWEVWAGDEEVRHRGSSGGALTALVGWLVDTGELTAVSGASVDPRAPRRTVPVRITSKAEALASAGSRYAPVAGLARPDALAPGSGLVAKPCEVSAARALLDRRGEHEQPLLLSFFCAGTPSQHATDTLVRDLGIPPGTPLQDLWYRGRGWPGSFTAIPVDGEPVQTSYDDSWGAHLGRSTQWRCKICPDGVGESSDLSAADFWASDDRGYPLFAEADGCSALLARTARGHDVVLRALDAGVLVGRPLDLDRLAAVQPLQVTRRMTLLGRLVGTRLAGRRVPRYVGFPLLRLGRQRWRTSLRTARGSFRRVRGRGAAAAPVVGSATATPENVGPPRQPAPR